MASSLSANLLLADRRPLRSEQQRPARSKGRSTAAAPLQAGVVPGADRADVSPEPAVHGSRDGRNGHITHPSVVRMASRTATTGLGMCELPGRKLGALQLERV